MRLFTALSVGTRFALLLAVPLLLYIVPITVIALLTDDGFALNADCEVQTVQHQIVALVRPSTFWNAQAVHLDTTIERLRHPPPPPPLTAEQQKTAAWVETRRQQIQASQAAARSPTEHEIAALRERADKLEQSERDRVREAEQQALTGVALQQAQKCQAVVAARLARL